MARPLLPAHRNESDTQKQIAIRIGAIFPLEIDSFRDEFWHGSVWGWTREIRQNAPWFRNTLRPAILQSSFRMFTNTVCRGKGTSVTSSPSKSNLLCAFAPNAVETDIDNIPTSLLPFLRVCQLLQQLCVVVQKTLQCILWSRFHSFHKNIWE